MKPNILLLGFLFNLSWLETMKRVVGELSSIDDQIESGNTKNMTSGTINGPQTSLFSIFEGIVLRSKNAKSLEPRHARSLGNADEADCVVLAAVGDRIPNSNDICTCSNENELDLTCTFEDVCSGSANDLCVESTIIHMDLNSGIIMEYCSVFQAGFSETCIMLGLNSAGNRIESCDVKYGGSDCDCNICDDRSSVAIDCSSHNCRATNNGCQQIDLTATEMLPIIPDFQLDDLLCPPTLAPTPAPVAPTPAPQPPTPRPTPTPAPTPQPIEPLPSKKIPTVPPNADRSCPIFPILNEEYDIDDQFCYCADTMVVVCVFGETCLETGLRVDYIEVNIDVSAGLPDITHCVEFGDGSGLERTCVKMSMEFDETISGCNEATYGEDSCDCFVCDDAKSLEIDCSMHKPGAATDGCQKVPRNLGPLIPAFDVRGNQRCGESNSGGSSEDRLDKGRVYFREPLPGEDRDGGSSGSGSPGRDCNLKQTLEAIYDNAKDMCTCEGDERVVCKEENYCHGNATAATESSSICADTVEIAMDIEDGISVTTCAVFDHRANGYVFGLTCVDIAFTIDLQLEECRRVTYDGQDCTCQVCPDGNSIELDCTEYDENAWTPCQSINLEERMPFVPNFDTNERSAATATTTKTMFSGLASILCILILNFAI